MTRETVQSRDFIWTPAGAAFNISAIPGRLDTPTERARAWVFHHVSMEGRAGGSDQLPARAGRYNGLPTTRALESGGAGGLPSWTERSSQIG